MKKVFPLLLLAVTALLYFFAGGPPYEKRELSLLWDGERVAKSELRVEVMHALRAKRAGGYQKLYEQLLKEYDAKDALNYLGIGLGDYLERLCSERQKEPVDATLMWTGDPAHPFCYREEQRGRGLSLVEAGRQIARAMDMGKSVRANLRTHEVEATVKAQDLKEITRELSRFSTEFATSGENRRHNLILAATAIGGTVLADGDSFSFNEIVGARSKERGFREANIVVNGNFVKGVGGGVCQVSTTLYNAVLMASLPVENAAAHSCPVSYVPCSRDCTVSSAIDFRFRNDTGSPLYIAAEIKGSTLTFVLYGKSKGEKVRLESEIVERLPYHYADEEGKPLPQKAGVEITPGREGIKSRLYAVRSVNGKEVRTLLRENLYPPKDAILKMRTE